MKLFSVSVTLVVTLLQLFPLNTQETCSNDNIDCIKSENKYGKETNKLYSLLNKQLSDALKDYQPCDNKSCNCHMPVIEEDLKPFKEGITKSMFELSKGKGTKYQIIEGKLFREKDCHFPARCAGVEHYLKSIAQNLSNVEFILNTRDWPQINHAWGHKKAPVFSFSKTKDYYDIMYPAWSFWEGGPAISLYPTGIGRWDKHRETISAAAAKWPWMEKLNAAFFRGSRTSDERDALILLSRSKPDLVDAQYTKNQAWKSDADTLYSTPASEVSFEDHCKYKYLFNYRGVAASFRFKHLFLCKSLVFHVGNEWLEFFYPSLKPWVHYIPINSTATKEEIENYIEFFKHNDALAKEIAERGFQHIWDHLTDSDVKCYWRRLFRKYAQLLRYTVTRDPDFMGI